MTSPPTTGDKLIGKAKRLLGELSGRPDLVLDGEAQDTGLPREDEAPVDPVPPDPRPGRVSSAPGRA